MKRFLLLGLALLGLLLPPAPAGAATITTRGAAAAQAYGSSAAPPRDPYITNVMLLLHGDGANASTTIPDSSINTKAITVGGAAQITTGQKKYGSGSISFAGGTSDTVIATAGTDFVFGAGDFTIEGWVYLNSSTGGFRTLFTTRTVSTGAFASWLGVDSAGKLAYFEAAQIVGDPVAIPATTWTHVAVTRQGTTLTLWKNGVSVATATNSTNLTNNAGSVGNDLVGSGGPFPMAGDLDDVRITKGVARYTAAFTPPPMSLPNPPSTGSDPFFANVGLLTHADAYVDVKGHALVQNNGPTISSATKKYGTGALGLNISGGTANVGSVASSAWQMGTGPFTVEDWVYILNPTSGSVQTLVSDVPASAADDGFLFAVTGAGKLIFWTWNNALVTGTTVLPANTWVYVAATYDGTNYRLFINGVLEATNAGAQNLSGLNDIFIGFSGVSGSPFNLNGYIDEVRVTKGVARYTASFPPPPRAFPDH